MCTQCTGSTLIYLKTALKSTHQLKPTLRWFFAINIGPLASIKLKGSSRYEHLSEKIEIYHLCWNHSGISTEYY